MKRVTVFLLILAAGPVLYGQNFKPANTLLWRISGNGLTRPSYLYGTMHLTDKRVFQFGDSVYKAIEQTDGFAAELDMARLGMQMINYVIAEKEARNAKEPVKVKDVVSSGIWERYKEQLEDKFYKPAEKITVDDLEAVESSLQSEIFKKGDMPTFLDAYLFGMARKQGKWVGGLEELRDQVEHISAEEDVEEKIQMALFDDKYYRSGVEKMIKIYVSQSLDSLDAFMYRQENGQKDYIMIKRNLKMARMMDSLSSVRSSFFAVGAAHLPGDSGVIALLRSKGFTVSPVISSKKISPDKYVLKTKEIPWVPVSVKDNSYALEMPGIAENIEAFESMGLDMKMFFDISFLKLYMTLDIELPEDRKKLGADSLYHSMRNRYTGDGKKVKEKQITVNGVEGREYSGSMEDGEMRIQVFIPGMERVILNAVFSLKEQALNDEESARFFRSFAYKGSPVKTTETEKEWSVQRYPQHFFTIEMPMKPREVKDASEEGKVIYNFQTVDMKHQVFYGMRVATVKEGLYDASADSNYFTSIKERMKASLTESSVLDSSFITVNNYPGYRFAIAGKAKGDIVEAKILAIARGNRSYYLYAVYAPGEENSMAADRFLGSFTMLPYDQTEWKTVTSPDGSFTVVSPRPLKKADPGKDGFPRGFDRFFVYDTATSVTTYIDKTIIPGWAWFSSDTAFLREKAMSQKNWGDSIVNYTVTIRENQVIADFMVHTRDNFLVKKVKMVMNGDEVFEIYGHYDPGDFAGIYKKFFDDFRVIKDAIATDRSVSKSNELVTVLQNADRKETDQVKMWWNDLAFSTSDLPALHKMMLKVYPDLDTSYHSDMNALVFRKIKELDSVHATIDYIRNNYGAITEENEYIKPFVISYLSGIKTAESYALLKNLLNDRPVNINQSVYISTGFYDSLRLTATLFPEMLKYADSEALSRYVAGITTSLLDSGMIDRNMIKQHAKRFTGYLKNKLDNNKADMEENGYLYYDYIQILGVVNSPESNGLLGRFAKFDNRGVRFRTTVALVGNNQPVDTRTIYTLATTDEYRHSLYDELKKSGKLKMFPREYLSRKALGQSKVFEYANDEESTPAVSYVGERASLYKGRQQKFCLYRVHFSGSEGESYLGVAGPYSSNDKDYNSTHEATGIHWESEFDAKKTDSLLKEYLLSLEGTEDKTADKEEALPPPPPAVIK